MESNEIFAKAAEYLSENGWHQGALGSHGGPRCAMGAIASAIHPVNWGDFLYTPTEAQRNEFYKALHRLGMSIWKPGDSHDSVSVVAVWNDRSSTTKEDVILAFKELANE